MVAIASHLKISTPEERAVILDEMAPRIDRIVACWPDADAAGAVSFAREAVLTQMEKAHGAGKTLPRFYLWVVARNAIFRAAKDKGAMIRRPPSTVEKAKREGRRIAAPKRETLGSWIPDPKSERKRSSNVPPMLELLEELYACCETPLDRQIVRLLHDGWKVDEIAQELRRCPATIYFHRKAIGKRYRQREAD